MNNEISEDEDLYDDIDSDAYCEEEEANFKIFFKEAVADNDECFYSVLTRLTNALDAGINEFNSANNPGVNNPILFINNFVKSILVAFETELFDLWSDFRSYEFDVKEIIEEGIIYKNDLVYQDIEIDESFLKNIIPEISNYKLFKIILNEIPPVFERIISFIIMDLSLNPQNFEAKVIDWGWRTDHRKIDRKVIFKRFNKSVRSLFGTHLDQFIQFTKKKYSNKTLIDYEPLLRTLFLMPIFHKLKFKVDHVQYTHRYLIMNDILSFTHPDYESINEVEWELRTGDNAGDSSKFKQKRLEEVNKFFKVKQLHKLK